MSGSLETAAWGCATLLYQASFYTKQFCGFKQEV
jgi:hypothetical protein